MMKPVFRAAALTVFSVFLAGVAPPDDRAPALVKGRQVWEGSKVVRHAVVEKDAVLEIKPGTKVRFVYEDRDGDGSGDAVLEVKGRIIAAGTVDDMVVFTGDPQKCNKAWKGIVISEGGSGEFTGSSFKCAEWGINLVNSGASVGRCAFEDNYGGIRIDGGDVKVGNSSFNRNEIGIRFEKSSPRITGNIFGGNKMGIFIKEAGGGAVISGNNFIGQTEHALAIGESQKESVDATGNWWGSTKDRHIRRSIFERANKGYTGMVKYAPFLEKENEKAGK